MKKEKYHFSAKMVPVFLVLHLALVISSLSGVCSKMAARQEFCPGALFSGSGWCWR